MAKQMMGQQKVKAYPYPSIFGSHASMVNQEKTEALRNETNDPTKVVIDDEYGSYVTTTNRLDDGGADPARYTTSRLGRLFESKSREEN